MAHRHLPHAFHATEGAAHEPAGTEWLRRQAFLRFITEQMLDSLLTIGATWLPDLVVRETAEYAGCLAAEYWGIPHAVLGKALGADYGQRERRASLLGMVRNRVGMPPDPDVIVPYRYLQLIPEPPAFHPPTEPLAPTAHFVRSGSFDRSGDEGLPAWIGSLPDRPTLHATLGTAMSRTSSLFDTILDALRNEPVNLILTVGRARDPSALGPQSDALHIERYIPHSLLLPYCDAVLTQGSINTVMTALSYGLPLVLLPIGADQPMIARRCAALGIARVVDGTDRTREAIRDAIRAVLHEPHFRRNAARFRAEIATMPGPERAVTLLEQLINEKRALYRTAHEEIIVAARATSTVAGGA